MFISNRKFIPTKFISDFRFLPSRIKKEALSHSAVCPIFMSLE